MLLKIRSFGAIIDKKTMILYPNAKINIGLNILSKRTDGYHNIETLFYPIKLSDKLVLSPSSHIELQTSGIKIDSDPDSNLVVKAYKLIRMHHKIDPVAIKLHKNIPNGAGLGGGSSDAAHMLLGLNKMFDLKRTNEQLKQYAAEIGSDCAFFIDNFPAMATGRGEVLKPLSICLNKYFLFLVKPENHISTKEAYAAVDPKIPEISLERQLLGDIKQWKDSVGNQFEASVFPKHPEILEIKTRLYQQGALYASMSGSGSSVYGIFEKIPHGIGQLFPDCFIHSEQMK